jgi:HEAT repeats
MRRRPPSDTSTHGSPLRGALDDLGNGRTVTVSFDLEGQGEELVEALRQITQQVSPVSAYRLRLGSHLVKNEPGGVLLDALASSSPSTRRAAAEACGLLRIEVAVPTLGVLLVDRVRRVRRAAAEALGRIGGSRAADQLIRGLRSRRLPVSWLLLALVRAVPDHYIETRLTGETDARALPWLVLVAGMRRRRAMRPRLAELLASDDRRTRAWACRALGWIGHPEDVYALQAVLAGDPDGQVKEAAARGLRRFHEPAALALLESIAAAKRPRVIALRPSVSEPVAAAPAVLSPAWASTSMPEPPAPPAYVPHIEPLAAPVAAELAAPAYIPHVESVAPRVAVEVAATAPRVPVVAPPVPVVGETKPAAAHGRSAIAPLLALRGVFKARPRRRPAGLVPLTPLEVAATPHHYKPDPNLLDGAGSFAEGA